MDGDGVQFWSEPSVANASVDVMLAPEEQDYALDEFRNLRIPCKMIMYDVGEVIRRTSSSQATPPTYRDGSEYNATLRQQDTLASLERFHSQFHGYSMIEAKVKELAKSPMVSSEIVGYSSEKRPLYLVKVSADRGATKKPVIFIDAGHHAREVSRAFGLSIRVEVAINSLSAYAKSNNNNNHRLNILNRSSFPSANSGFPIQLCSTYWTALFTVKCPPQ